MQLDVMIQLYLVHYINTLTQFYATLTISVNNLFLNEHQRIVAFADCALCNDSTHANVSCA